MKITDLITNEDDLKVMGHFIPKAVVTAASRGNCFSVLPVNCSPTAHVECPLQNEERIHELLKRNPLLDLEVHVS